jgi:F420-dependent oxidoreductase-like protein
MYSHRRFGGTGVTARLAFQFPHERNAPRSELLSFVKLADDVGYDTIFVPEAWYRDAFTTLGWIAANTRRVRLGPGIVNVFSRTPALIAQSTATLDELSGGRAILGLGTSGPVVIEDWHGVKFESALQRTRETVEIVRQALSGAKVDYNGEIFKLRNFRLGFTAPRTQVPIYLASMGPKNNALTGEIADGWTPIWLPCEGIPAALKEIGKRLDVAPCVVACVTDSVEQGRDLVRPHLAYYVGGMGTFYRDAMARFGFSAEAAAIHSLWRSGHRREAVHAVTDRMVDSVAAVGPAEQCRNRISDYRQSGVDMPVLVMPHGASADIVRNTLESLI